MEAGCTGKYALLKIPDVPMVRKLGPKTREGDRQARSFYTQCGNAEPHLPILPVFHLGDPNRLERHWVFGRRPDGARRAAPSDAMR